MNLSLPFALMGLGGSELFVLIPFCGILLAAIIVPISLYFSHQRQKLWHETARIALEKGQPLPPTGRDEDSPEARRPRPFKEIRTALILISITAGLYFSSDNVGDHQRHFYPGMIIPACIGCALLLSALINLIFRKPSPNDSSVSTKSL